VIDADPASLDAAQRKALLVEVNMQKSETLRAAAAAEFAASAAPVNRVEPAPSAATFDESALIDKIANRVTELVLSRQPRPATTDRDRDRQRRSPPRRTSPHRQGPPQSTRGRDFRRDQTCYYCKAPGHLIRECRKRQRDEERDAYFRSLNR